MNIISILFTLIASAALLAAVSLIFMKIYGKGIFCGLKLTAVVALGKNDDVEAILYKIADNLCSDCECSELKIIIIDLGMNIDQRGICQNYCDKYNFFIISDFENACHKIVELQKNTNI